MQVINLSHENNLIFIDTYVHELKAICIVEGKTKGCDPFYSYPVVDYNWKVEPVFKYYPLCTKSETIPITNHALQEAINRSVRLGGRMDILILHDVMTHGVKLDASSCVDEVELYVAPVGCDDDFCISVNVPDDDPLEVYRNTHFPLPEIFFNLDQVPFYTEDHIGRTLSFDAMTITYNRILTEYACLFHRPNLHVSLTVAPFCTKALSKKLSRIATILNKSLNRLNH